MFTAKYTGVCLISISSWRKLCRESGQFLFCDKIFPDERFYPTNTREFKKSEVEEKMTSNNSLGNRALLDMKYYKICPGCLCFISY